MIRMQGKGEAIGGGATGDLYVKVHVQKDKNFTREGNHLVTTLSIKLTDALLGGTFPLNTPGTVLEGSVTPLTIPKSRSFTIP